MAQGVCKSSGPSTGRKKKSFASKLVDATKKGPPRKGLGFPDFVGVCKRTLDALAENEERDPYTWLFDSS
jgi:hypothetical protein